jgi:ribosomal-protein-serine acetyltransferase
VFSHKLMQDTHLRLLEERHAEELTDLTDRNREHLRAWLPLPWVDTNRTLEDRKNFIRGALGAVRAQHGLHCWHLARRSLGRGY